MSVRARVITAVSLATAAALLGGPSASANLTVEQGRHRPHVIKVKVDPRLFGVHDANLHSLSRRGTGSIRLWDTGTTWAQMQPTDGPVNFSRIDQVVSDAWKNHTEVTFVAAMTPAWAAADPSRNQKTDAPDVAAYRAFLQAVMTHFRNYQGSGRPGIANYQIWNEANISTFWTGTDAQLADLTKAAYDVRNQVDPGVRIIAPAMVTRLRFEQKAIAAFYATQVPSTGRPVWRYVDAISLNLYPTDRIATRSGLRPSTPEDSMALLASTRAMLAKVGVPASIPVWNTEVNYGMGRAATVVPISEARQIANVMRTYLLNAAQGVKRVDWYAYDMGTLGPDGTGGTLGNTLLTDPTDRASGALTPAGLAFTRIQGWMKGTLVGTRTERPCGTDRHGTYTCLVKYAHGVGRIYWNPERTARVRLVPTASRKFTEYGVRSRARGGHLLKVTYRPVLVKSRR